jgi:hypothetical protein
MEEKAPNLPGFIRLMFKGEMSPDLLSSAKLSFEMIVPPLTILLPETGVACLLWCCVSGSFVVASDCFNSNISDLFF